MTDTKPASFGYGIHDKYRAEDLFLPGPPSIFARPVVDTEASAGERTMQDEDDDNLQRELQS